MSNLFFNLKVVRSVYFLNILFYLRTHPLQLTHHAELGEKSCGVGKCKTNYGVGGRTTEQLITNYYTESVIAKAGSP